MENHLRIKVSRHVSYLLRHNPEDLEMDDEGFVELDQLLYKLRRRFPTIDKRLLTEMVELRKKPKGRVYISSLTDAYQPLERKYELTRKLLEILLKHQFPISIQTKSALVLRDLDLIRRFHEREVGFTITCLNDDIRKSFEPMSSSPEEKLSATKELKDHGVRTYVFFGPVLPYISDQNIEQYFQQISAAGADYVLVDKLNLKPGLWANLDRYVSKDFPELHEKWKDTLLQKNDYYGKLKVEIDNLCQKLESECKFCF